jgi:sugar phosphate isomerase/epimerase
MRIVFSLFPKFYKHLDARGLAALVREVGLDTANLVIRDGYWVGEKDLAREVPAFVRAMRAEGLEVRFATAGFSPEQLAGDATPLKVLADSGIREFRMSYFRPQGGDVRAAFAEARRKLEQMALLCEQAGVRAVYQVHHGTLIASASAAWLVVQGLPARYIGVELDPGNQSFEGMEDWGRSARLLAEYCVAVGVKDTCLARDPAAAGEPGKGWRRSWAPCDEGIVNWHDVVRGLKAIDFAGTFVFMPFYDENDLAAMTAKLKREVVYIRRVVAEVIAEP